MSYFGWDDVSEFEGSCASCSENAVTEESEEPVDYYPDCDPEDYGYGAWRDASEEETEVEEIEALPETGRCLGCTGPCTLSFGFLCARCERVSR